MLFVVDSLQVVEVREDGFLDSVTRIRFRSFHVLYSLLYAATVTRVIDVSARSPPLFVFTNRAAIRRTATTAAIAWTADVCAVCRGWAYLAISSTAPWRTATDMAIAKMVR